MKAVYTPVLTLVLMVGLCICDQANQTVIQDWLLDNGSLSVMCSVKTDPSEIRSISLSVDGTFTATIQHTNRIQKPQRGYNGYYGYQMYDISGQLDKGAPSSTPFLKIQKNHTMCNQARYRCVVRFDDYKAQDVRVEKKSQVCDGSANMKLERPDFKDPAHFVLTCTINASLHRLKVLELEGRCRILDGEVFCRKTAPSDAITSSPVLATPDGSLQDGKDSVDSVREVITTMQIRRLTKTTNAYGRVYRVTGHIVARTTLNFSTGNVFLNETYARQGMTASGSINQSNASQSFLQIESEICEHAGDYVCDVFYRAEEGRKGPFSVAQNTVPDACATNIKPRLWQSDSRRPDIVYTEADPTTFSLGCEIRKKHEKKGTQTVSLELSLLDNQSLTRNPIAFYNTLTRDSKGRLDSEYQKRGFGIKVSRLKSGSSDTSLIVNTRAGICNDTGVYRCTMLYWDMRRFTPHVAIAETRMAACNPGAVIERKVHKKKKRHSFSFKCSANATLAAKLLSLEISRLYNHSRKVTD